MTFFPAASGLRARLQLQGRALFQPGRSASTKPPPPPGRTIPGPSWAWIEPLAQPFRAYGRAQTRSPYITQLSSSLVIYFCGDLSAQLVAYHPPTTSESLGVEARQDYMYAPERGLRAMLIGGLSSIPSYHWFLFLGRNFNYSSHILSLTVKIVINQTCFTPIFNSYFFGMQSILSGKTWAETKRRIKDTVPTSWKMSWRVWPAVTAFSFTFIKEQYRSTFAGVIAIGWQTYLSWLNSRAARMEKGEDTKGGSQRRTKAKT
ncbi:Mpv17/PMP22-like protein 3 [Elsinoe fawcettii]|nr:Mpv17/PMP22-like protein 3 [Elsinoe fawcettii]